MFLVVLPLFFTFLLKRSNCQNTHKHINLDASTMVNLHSSTEIFESIAIAVSRSVHSSATRLCNSSVPVLDSIFSMSKNEKPKTDRIMAPLFFICLSFPLCNLFSFLCLLYNFLQMSRAPSGHAQSTLQSSVSLCVLIANVVYN